MDYSKYYTPLSIAQLLIKQLDIDTPEKIVDICCGSCNLLNAAKQRWRKAMLFGADIANHEVSDVAFENIDGREYALNHQKEFSLVLANPPFDYLEKKNEFPQLFQTPFDVYNTSRLEIEMLIANLLMLKDGGTLLIIMPSSFVEAERYSEIRKIISSNYYIESIIKLDEKTFGSSKINSYALIIHNDSQNKRVSKIGFSSNDTTNCIYYTSQLTSEEIKTGNWIKRTVWNQEKSIDIKRGNISSSCFIKRGQPILHTAKCREIWKPSKRYISKKITPTIFAEHGDIIVSRIGKSAGQWCVYEGEKIAISDCLYRIKDPNGSLLSKINGKTFDGTLKGVATRYITINDFFHWVNSV